MPMNDELGVLPSLRAEDLNGRALTLPRDLPSERTLLLVAFEREQQNDIETWVEGLKLNEASFKWLIAPVIQEPGRAVRFMIDQGMRAGIRGQTARAQVVTLYTDREKWLQEAKLPDTSQIYALVVARDGRVLARVDGRYHEENAARLLDVLS